MSHISKTAASILWDVINTGQAVVALHHTREMDAAQALLDQGIVNLKETPQASELRALILKEPAARTAEDRKAMFERYAAQPNPLAGKEVIGVLV